MPVQRLVHYFFLGFDLKRYRTDDCQSTRLERNEKAIFACFQHLFDQPYGLPPKMGLKLDFTPNQFSSFQ